MLMLSEVVMLLPAGLNLVFWFYNGSKRQRSGALSSDEAEYVALSIAIQAVQWLRHLLTELDMGNFPSTVIKVDN
ncbi:hypothetical protein PsorP6_018805 [Peronosclerospora sorghi]|nr:hypothetical protein PsorP6_018805 [Peronosclerospora sorghi]